MSNLYIVATIGNLPAAGKACAAYNASKFVQNPTALSPLPAQAADATSTTASDGTAEFTGLSGSTSYWIMVADVDGYHWTFCAAVRVGNTAETPVQISYRLIYTSLIDQALGSLSVWVDDG